MARVLEPHPRPPPLLTALSEISSMPAVVERRHQLQSANRRCADDSFARLHALDGRQRQGGQLRELALVEAGAAPVRLEAAPL